MYKTIIAILMPIVLFSSMKNINELNKTNSDSNISKKLKVDKNITLEKSNIQKAILKEKKFAKEQKFYKGKDYNLSEHKVDKSILDKVPIIEPEYDFDMDDVYSD